MKVRELIQELCEYNLDDEVEIYVCAKTDTIRDFVEKAEDSKWCLDEILQIDEIDDRGGILWLKAEEIF